jgi:hypothetical protein
MSLLGGMRANASLAISPSTIDNAYAGPLDLTITGLDSNGQSVIIEEYYDSDASGTINAGDILLHKFVVTDGQAVSIAGHRDLNIPGDEDGLANSTIHTRFLYSAEEIVGRIDGPHIFRVSPSGAGFPPFTTNFAVTQHDYAGSGISGTVTNGASSQPGALVFLLTQSGSDHNILAVTIAGAGGNYSLKTAPGNYQIMASKSGFVFNLGAASTITVPAGSFVTGQTATLTASARTISGTVRDTGTMAGLPAIGMQGQSNSGYVAITLTDGNGNYTIDATTGSWKISEDENAVPRLGCLTFKTTESSPGPVTGLNIDLPHETSLIYGTVKTAANVAVPFVDVKGNTNGTPSYKSAAVTDAGGNYTMGVTPGSWEMQTTPAGYVGDLQDVVVNTNGSAVLQNLVVHPVTAHLRGQIRDNHNNIVGNVVIITFDPTINGNSISVRTTADANGMFDLGVYGGGGTATKTWELQLDQGNTPGMYVSTDAEFAVQDGVDINGINYLVYIVTAHLRGQVLDENDNPIGNIAIFASLNPNGFASTGSNVDNGGNFDIPLFGGNWNLGLSNIEGLGLIPQDFSISVTDNVDQNGLIFRAIHGNFTITGTVRSNTNVAIPGVMVFGTATNGGNTYYTSTTTIADGSYSLPVFSSTWSVGVDSNDLISRGYQPVSNQNVFVSGNVPGINFIAGPLASAVSRKLHGGIPRDINLPLTGSSGIECRSGGGTNDYQIVLVFGQAVTFNNASLTAGIGSVSSTSGSGTSTLTINLTGVTNAQRITLTVAGVNDGTNIFDVAVPMGVLLGDTNGNSSVNAGDVAQTKGQSGQAVTAANFRQDVNANGSINAGDVALVKSKSGTSLP